MFNFKCFDFLASKYIAFNTVHVLVILKFIVVILIGPMTTRTSHVCHNSDGGYKMGISRTYFIKHQIYLN